MSEKEYRGAPGVNKSTLWEIRKSPLHYKYALEHPAEPTPALVFGGALHAYVLQPETFAEQYAVCPVCDRRTKDGKALYAEFSDTLNGRREIGADDMAKIVEMRSALMENQFAVQLLSGEHEKPIFWTDGPTGEVCKGRLDAVIEAPIFAISDYKSCENAETEVFLRAAIKNGYDVQAAHYLNGMRALHGINYVYLCIAQEKTPPYAVNVIQLDEPLIERGGIILRRMLDTYHQCRETGNWYGYEGPDAHINVAMLPAWAAEE